MQLEIEPALTTQQMDAVRAIRYEVFVIGQNCPEDLEWEYEEDSHHYLASINKQPVATARWRETEKGIKLERFAVLDLFRGKGIATELIRYLLNLHRNSNKTLYLHAQLYVADLYAKQGFIPEGDHFFEAGIEHVKMVYSEPKTVNLI